jgi:alkylhydroperoxidase/carboxymuconolactone decarboxylase family protein YurZ
LLEKLNLYLEQYQNKKKNNIERANKRLKEINEKNPEIIKEYRKKAYQKRKNKIMEENDLNDKQLNTI